MRGKVSAASSAGDVLQPIVTHSKHASIWQSNTFPGHLGKGRLLKTVEERTLQRWLAVEEAAREYHNCTERVTQEIPISEKAVCKHLSLTVCQNKAKCKCRGFSNLGREIKDKSSEGLCSQLLKYLNVLIFFVFEFCNSQS